MPPVRLLSAVAGTTPTGGGAYAYAAQIEAVVEDLAYAKTVAVWGHRPLDERWQLYPGTFARSLPAAATSALSASGACARAGRSPAARPDG